MTMILLEHHWCPL